MPREYPKMGCLGCGKIFPARRYIFGKVKEHMSICCPEKLNEKNLQAKCALNSKMCEVPGDEAMREKELVVQQRAENKKIKHEWKQSQHRYTAKCYGGWGYGGQYESYGGSSAAVIFYRPDGDTEGKDIGWCRSNGFFQVKPGLWSGPWYYDHFPEERKEVQMPHECPVPGCRKRFKEEDQMTKHLRVCNGKAHEKYRKAHNIAGGRTQEEIEEEERRFRAVLERAEREREEERLNEILWRESMRGQW